MVSLCDCYLPRPGQKSGAAGELGAGKTNGALDTPMTLQQFHEQRQKLDKVGAGNGNRSQHLAASTQRGSSSSLNTPTIELPAEIPRAATVSYDVPRRMLPVAVEDIEQSVISKKGSIRHVRGHKRGRSWGGTKALEAEIGMCDQHCVCGCAHDGAAKCPSQTHFIREEVGVTCPLPSSPTPEGLEFHIINSDRKAWVFEAGSVEEKRQWVQAIEAGIRDYFSSSTYRKEENSLCEGDKDDIQGRPGNDFCADCNAPSEWGEEGRAVWGEGREGVV